MNMNTDKPAVSIIVPCYNPGKHFKKMLASVFGQNFQDFELILIDDGCTDGTDKLIDECHERYPDRVHVVHKENGGQSIARNMGIEMAKGEYLLFWDSDDYADADYIETLYTAGVEADSEMVLTGSHYVDEYGNILENLNYPVHMYPGYIGRRLSPHGKLYRKDFIERHHLRFAEGKVFEDNPFNFMAMFLCRNQVIKSYSGHYQVVHTGSTMSTVMKSEKIPYDALEEAMRYVNEHRDEVNDYAVYEYTVISFFTYLIFLGNRTHMQAAHHAKNGYKNKRKLIGELCDYVQRVIPEYLPNYSKNVYVGIGKGKPLALRQRAGVWTMTILLKTHMLKAFALVYYLII